MQQSGLGIAHCREAWQQDVQLRPRVTHVLYEHAEQPGLDFLQAVRHGRDAVLDREKRHEEQQHLRVPLRLPVLQPATWSFGAQKAGLQVTRD